MEETASTSRA